jgi:hypothetical protein
MFGSGLLCSSGSSCRTPLSARPRARRHVHDGRRLLPDGLSGAWRAVGGACCSERRGSRVAASGTAERGATGRCWGAVRVLRAARSSCVPMRRFSLTSAGIASSDLAGPQPTAATILQPPLVRPPSLRSRRLTAAVLVVVNAAVASHVVNHCRPSPPACPPPSPTPPPGHWPDQQLKPEFYL